MFGCLYRILNINMEYKLFERGMSEEDEITLSLLSEW